MLPNIPGNYTHRTVNHSRHFVNPVNRAHRNSVKAYWSRAKAVFKRMNGTSKEMVSGYLDEFMWRERYDGTYNLAYLNILRHIAERYPCKPVSLHNAQSTSNGPFQGHSIL